MFRCSNGKYYLLWYLLIFFLGMTSSDIPWLYQEFPWRPISRVSELMDLDQSPYSKHQAIRTEEGGYWKTAQAIATGSDSSSMLDTWVATWSRRMFSRFFYPLNSAEQNIQGQKWVTQAFPILEGLVGSPQQPLDLMCSSVWTLSMAGAPQLRLRNAFGKLVTQGDLDRCAGLLGRKAEVWILRAFYCLGCLERWRDMKWRNRFICIHIMYDVHILYLIINILSMHMYGLFTVNRLYQKWDQTDEIPAPLMYILWFFWIHISHSCVRF